MVVLTTSMPVTIAREEMFENTKDGENLETIAESIKDGENLRSILAQISYI